MSQLILNFFKKSESIGLALKAVGTCNYEDHIEVKGKKAYDLLLLSNQRTKDLRSYTKGLKALLREHRKIQRMPDTLPMLFGWSLDGVEYKSTSLFFEYYMASLADALAQVQEGLEAEGEKNHLFKTAKTQMVHLLGMFDEWKTQTLILPQVPYLATPMFLNSMLCFVNGCLTLGVINKLEDSSVATGYATAMNSFAEVWPRHAYGKIALQHFLVSRALLYDKLASNCEDPNEKLACLTEVSNLLGYINYKDSYLKKSIRDKMDDIENSCNDTINDLVNTHYAIAKDINDIAVPRSYKLRVCKSTGNFGCKCKE